MVPFTITKEEFLEEFGETEQEFDNPNSIDNYLKLACKQVWDFVCRAPTSINWESMENNLSDYQKRHLKKASLYQAQTIIHQNGSVSGMSQFDVANNQFMDREQIRKNILCVEAEDELLHSGFLYNGLY